MSETRDGDYAHWLGFVRRFAEAYAAGRQWPPAHRESSSAAREERVARSGPRVMICAPHPDDELLSGALALRLQREGGCSVLVLALTLGSDPIRREERREELAAACRRIGFEWRLAAEPLGFPRLRPEAALDAAGWQDMVATVASHFRRESPALVLVSHDRDGHPAHEAAHRLVIAALARYTMDGARDTLLAETEYWRPLSAPNLLVGVAPEDLALLVTALTRHRGEIARHPYHLRQPARMMDSLRRGSELLAGFGTPAADWVFGELYRLGRMSAGKLDLPGAPALLPPGDPIDLPRLAALFRQDAQAE